MKKLTGSCQVGNGAMTSQEVHGMAIFARNGRLKGDIDHDKASFDYILGQN